MTKKNAKAKKTKARETEKTALERAIKFAEALRRDLLLQVAVDGDDAANDAGTEIVKAAVVGLTAYSLLNPETAIVHNDEAFKAVEIAIPATEYDRTMSALKAAADAILKGDDKLIVRHCVDVDTVVHEKRDIITRIGALDDGEATR